MTQTHSIAHIALDVPLPGPFDYLIPPACASVQVGQRVVVPFGRRRMAGIVVGLANSSEFAAEKLKPIEQIFDAEPLLPEELLSLLYFASQYYHYPLGETVMRALPGLLREAEPLPDQKLAWLALTDAGRAALTELPKRAVVKQKLFALLSHNQACSYDTLREQGSNAAAQVREWLQAGLLVAAEAPPTDYAASPIPSLNSEQQAAVSSVTGSLGQFKPWLLHGVTGSGKTEVYLNIVAEVLQRGGQALVLVPEINLTPQLEGRFRNRFPNHQLVTLHSNLAEGERLRNWQAAASGKADVVLGTRLSIFTPLPRLAIIIVDEEHDASFKQQEGLRYSARDIAAVRAQRRSVPLVLGSATPSLESWYNAQSGKYGLLQLQERAVRTATLPTIRRVDTRINEPSEGLTEPVIEALRKTVARGEQALVFLNRRGYAPVLYCGGCGWKAECHRCAATLVWHARNRRLRCHHCGHEERPPVSCPKCGNMDLHPLGEGTQRIEDVLQSRLPQARILRVDRDSTRNKGSFDSMLEQIHGREIDILVGTQMLAKGHDFPHVSLVVVLNADGALYSTDFRAGERLFALLMQVAGRAGRAELPGEVWIQTQFPDHPLYRALQQHDYTGYAAELLAQRQSAGFPPYEYQAVLRAEAHQVPQVEQFLQQAARLAQPLSGDVLVYDPVVSLMPRVANRHRWQLLIQSDSRQALQKMLFQWEPQLWKIAPRELRWNLDVDPLDV